MLEVTDLIVHRNKQFSLSLPKLTVAPQHILCVTGPNGSGKTTLIECLAGLLRPDHGTITLAGKPIGTDLAYIKARLGYIPDDETWFVNELSAREYLQLLQAVYVKAGVTADMQSRTAELTAALQFSAFDQPLASLSHGNKKKVQIIAGLLHEPQVLIVDELRNGLDPIAIIAAEHILRREAKRGACIVAATHDLWWAERMASDILLLVNGKPAVSAKTRAIIKKYESVEKLFTQTVGLDVEHATI